MTGEMPLCLCDMFPDPHAHDAAEPPYLFCETQLTGPMISPHLFPGQFTAIDPYV